MSSYDKDPQRVDAESHTQKDPVGASHGTVDNLNDQVRLLTSPLLALGNSR